MSNYDYLLCHYHRVDSLLWLEVRNWLQQVLICRVEQCTDTPTLFVPGTMWNELNEFVRQMECAYLHPRRDSFHVQKCLISYSGFSVPENHVSRKNNFSVKKSSFRDTALPSMKKNLKSYRKEGVV